MTEVMEDLREVNEELYLDTETWEEYKLALLTVAEETLEESTVSYLNEYFASFETEGTSELIKSMNPVEIRSFIKQ